MRLDHTKCISKTRNTASGERVYLGPLHLCEGGAPSAVMAILPSRRRQCRGRVTATPADLMPHATIGRRSAVPSRPGWALRHASPRCAGCGRAAVQSGVGDRAYRGTSRHPPAGTGQDPAMCWPPVVPGDSPRPKTMQPSQRRTERFGRARRIVCQYERQAQYASCNAP